MTDPRLYKEIIKALLNIQHDSFCARNVKKSLIPSDLIKKYGLDNLGFII
jgi:hypothetical protein